MRRKLFLLILLSFGLSAFAQTTERTRHYDEFSGLSHWHVSKVAQDRQGMIWIATWNGLDRFDGVEFHNFKSFPGDGSGMTSNGIQDMRLAENGNLLCFIDGRIYEFDLRTYKFRHLREKEEAVHLKEHERRQWGYTSLTDMNGNVWSFSSDGLDVRYASKQPYETFSLAYEDEVRAAFAEKSGRYWICTRSHPAVRLFSKDNKPLGYIGKDGRLHDGFTEFFEQVYCVCQTSPRDFWLGTKPGGVYHLAEADGGFKITHYAKQEDEYSLSDNSIYDIKQDRKGRLWIATFDDGVNCLAADGRFVSRGNLLRNYPKDSNSRIRSLLVVGDTLLVAGADGLLVMDISGDDFTEMTCRQHSRELDEQEWEMSSSLMRLYKASDGNIYICTNDGMARLRCNSLMDERLRFETLKMSDKARSSISLSAAECFGKLWIQNSNNIVSYSLEDGSMEYFGTNYWQSPFRFSEVQPLLLPDGRLLFCHQKGAFTVNPRKMRRDNHVPRIALSNVKIQDEEPDYTVNARDTIVLTPGKRSLTLAFSALDFCDSERIEYAFLFGDAKDWHEIGNNHSVTLLDLKPREYTLKLRSTNSSGQWVDNVRVVTIIVEPTIWETKTALCVYLLLILCAVYATYRTVRYIRKIKRQRKETLEAYLALLEKWEDSGKSAREEANAPEESCQKNPAIEISPEDSAFMRKVVAFVEEHIADADLAIEEIASAVAMSRSVFYRKIKSLLGVTPLDFLKQARLKRACQMLTDTRLTVNEVAYASGFSDPKYFSKVFKAAFGASPTEYRKGKNRKGDSFFGDGDGDR